MYCKQAKVHPHRRSQIGYKYLINLCKRKFNILKTNIRDNLFVFTVYGRKIRNNIEIN